MAENVLMLALSPTMEEGTITVWHKNEGDSISEGDLLCEVETDKAIMEYESANAGTILKILVKEGEQARVGVAIAIVGEAGEDVSGLIAEIAYLAEKAEKPEPVGAPGRPGPAVAKAPLEIQERTGRIKASPLARSLAAEHRLDLHLVRGSGPGGRIVKRDLEEALSASMPPPAAPPPPVGPAAETGPAAGAGLPGPAGPLRDERIPLSGKRKVIAGRLAESKFSAPHYYLKIDVVVDGILAARKSLNSSRSDKVSFNAYLIKLTAEALRRNPMVNASWEGDSILKHGRIDIGLAVAQDDGLIAPVVRDCGGKGIIAIDQELKVLIDKARNNRLTLEEYTGATFTISSLGSYGILDFTAIINPPGAAILAVGKAQRVPVVDETDQVKIQSKMILSLSCDHRVIDGAVGAAFLKDLKDMIEDPFAALY